MATVVHLPGSGLPPQIDLRLPISMLVCYITAILCAVGHHILNLCLHGKPVEELSINQQWVARSGNALAYMVKVLLVLATGTAYCQCIWQKVKEKPTKIGHFDTLFGVQDNIFELRRLGFWVRRPTLALIVLILWSLPLVAIITPGTLSVVDKPITQPVVISVQQREYGRGLYAASVLADNGTVIYGGARSYLKGPTMASLVETEILSVGHSATNLTYNLDFYGPAIKCTKAGDQLTNSLASIITQYQSTNKSTVVFDTWVPKPNSNSNQTIVDGAIILDSDKNRDLRILDQTSTDATTIYYSLAPPPSTESSADAPIYVIQCSLYNASWHLNFDVRSTGEQTLTPSIRFENWMPGWSSINPPLKNGTETDTIFDYAGLMETFGAITTGRLEVPDDPNLPFVQTSIALETSPILFADATPAPFTDEAMITLQRTLEETFTNMTLSARYAVLPRQDLRGDTPLLSLVDVDASSTFTRNVYDYKSRDLIISYSLAVILSTLCILLAVHAIRDMGAVYCNNFSTAVRVTRGQTRLDHLIVDENDRSGAEPLPKRVADAYIWVGKEQKMGMGIGRGRVGTETSMRSEKSARKWWGKQKVMDLESPPEKETTTVLAKEIRGVPVGNWI